MSDISHLGELQAINHFEKEKGFAVYLPIKDKGIDFVVVKNECFYQIQVKCSTFQKDRYFWFDLKKDRLRYGQRIFYVFVPYILPRRTFMGRAKNFLVVPSMAIRDWVTAGTFVTKEGNPNIINVYIYPDFENKKWVYRNKGKEIDLTPYWNNFAAMKTKP